MMNTHETGYIQVQDRRYDDRLGIEYAPLDIAAAREAVASERAIANLKLSKSRTP